MQYGPIATSSKRLGPVCPLDDPLASGGDGQLGTWFLTNKHISITRDTRLVAIASQVSGITSGSSWRAPVSDFRTDSDAKVIIHYFCEGSKMPPEATSGHISWETKNIRTISYGNLFITMILTLGSRLKPIFKTKYRFLLLKGWTQKQGESDPKINSTPRRGKSSK